MTSLLKRPSCMAVLLCLCGHLGAADKNSNATGLQAKIGNHQLLTKESAENENKWTYEMKATGIGTPEKLSLKGKVSFANSIKHIELEESGVTAKGVSVKTHLAVTREVRKGLLLETLKRTSKKTGPEALGGLPAQMIVQYEADGTRRAKVWFSTEANIEQDLPDHEYEVERGTTSLSPTLQSVPVREGADAGLTPIFALSSGIAFAPADEVLEFGKVKQGSKTGDKEKDKEKGKDTKDVPK